VFALLRSLFGRLFGSSAVPAEPSPKPAAPASASAPRASTAASAPASEPEPRTATSAPAAALPAGPSPREPQLGNLPGRQRAAMLDGRAITTARLLDEEETLLGEIDHRIETGRFELPQLPSTSMAIMSLVNDPRVEISALTRMISSDPVLSGQLVRTANSALYAGQEPIRTIQDGVMRIGMRALRTLVLSASMKGILLTGKGVASYGKSVWRQSLSVARIAWSIGPLCGFDKDSAFLLALLHDVGKLPLLAMLDEESRKGRQVSRALIGKVFQRFHEKVGCALANRWKLGAELVSITGNHHNFAENQDFPRSAALVSLAHKLDLYQSLRDERGFDALAASEELVILNVPPANCRKVLDLAVAAYAQGDEAAATTEDAHAA
jgi:putative nucleotidyltransferase with HDIG domain